MSTIHHVPSRAETAQVATMASYHGETLPDEILSVICQELGNDRDFDSLFKCALSSKSFADPALRTLYQ